MDTTSASAVAFRFDRERSLRIAFSCRPGVDVLALTGAFDIFTAHRLRDAVWSSLCTQPLLVLDLRDVGFLDSRGIATLVAVRRCAVRRDAEVVVCAEDHVGKLLRICRLDTVLRVVEPADNTDPVYVAFGATA